MPRRPLAPARPSTLAASPAVAGVGAVKSGLRGLQRPAARAGPAGSRWRLSSRTVLGAASAGSRRSSPGSPRSRTRSRIASKPVGPGGPCVHSGGRRSRARATRARRRDGRFPGSPVRRLRRRGPRQNGSVATSLSRRSRVAGSSSWPSRSTATLRNRPSTTGRPPSAADEPPGRRGCRASAAPSAPTGPPPHAAPGPSRSSSARTSPGAGGPAHVADGLGCRFLQRMPVLARELQQGLGRTRVGPARPARARRLAADRPGRRRSRRSPAGRSGRRMCPARARPSAARNCVVGFAMPQRLAQRLGSRRRACGAASRGP